MTGNESNYVSDFPISFPLKFNKLHNFSSKLAKKKCPTSLNRFPEKRVYRYSFIHKEYCKQNLVTCVLYCKKYIRQKMEMSTVNVYWANIKGGHQFILMTLSRLLMKLPACFCRLAPSTGDVVSMISIIVKEPTTVEVNLERFFK